MSKLIDLTGKEYGKLTVLHKSKRKSRKNAFWTCKCDCGKIISARSDNLRKVRKKSCGCDALHDTAIYKQTNN